MEAVQLKGNGQIRAGRIELDVPHLGKTLTYVLPLIGPSYHKTVMSKIDSQALLRPTTAQTFSLVDLALKNQDNQYCAEIVNRFKNNYLWTSTESITSPEGHIVYDNVDGKMPQDSKGLVRLADGGDTRIRVVKPGFKTGFFSLPDFLKHPVLIAQVGEQMIPIVERVAKTLNKAGGYVFTVEKSKTDDKRLTAVDSLRYNVRLGLDGDYRDGYNNGFASGVLK